MSTLEWDKSTTNSYSLSFAEVGMTSFNISTLLALCSCYGLLITLLWGFQNNKVRWHVRGSWSVHHVRSSFAVLWVSNRDEVRIV